MLIRFEVSNFRSILDPVELSMVAVDKDRPEARPVANIGESLLPVAAVFGPNASGKSNVLAALAWLLDGVALSLRSWDDEIPVEPFARGDNSGSPTEFTFESTVDGIRFEYVVELDRTAVRYEALFHYPEKKRRRIFEREGNDLKLQRGLGGLAGTRELLTDRVLALSIARRFDEPLVSHFVDDLRNSRSIGTTQSTARWFHGVSTAMSRRYFSGEHDLTRKDRDEALALLRMADLGIEDVVIDVENEDASSSKVSPRARLVHRIADELMPFDFEIESNGTRTWFSLIGPLLTALKNGTLLVFDELDANLHPTLSAHLIRLFHDPLTNPNGAQLIFSAHDASLLNHLNRDEVWLTEKAADGTTRLGALAEFAGERVRKSQNLERAYLGGRFGALPDVDRTELLRALGLVG